MRKTRTGIALALLAALAALALPSVAAALAPTTSPLPGSTFQAGDGNQDDPGGDVSSPADGIADVDWQGRSASVTTSGDPNLLDSTFGGGNKESEPDKWFLTTSAGGVTPGKSNLLASWTVTEPTTSNTFLYLAFRRNDSSGNTNLSFELNQRSDTWVNSVGTRVPCRVDGDVVVSYEVASGGTPPNVEIVAYVWTSTTTDPASGCGKKGTFTAITPGPAAQGAVNGTPIANYLDPLAYGSTFPTGTFGEAGLNLSLVLAGTGDPCFSFGQIQMHSRSAVSIDSQLQDFVAPVPAVTRSCSVSGRKFHDRDADGGDETGDADASNDDPSLAGWTFYVDYDGDGVLDADEPHATTGADGSYTIADVKGGTWKVREVAQAGWTCTAPATADAHGCYREYTFSSGNILGADFGNTRPPTITVQKQTAPGGDATEFAFSSAGVAALDGASLADGESESATVAPGTYTVSEDAAAGWDLSALECSDGSAVDLAARSVTFDVESGDEVTCVFTNTKRGSVRIAKQTAPDGDATEFGFSSGDVAAFDGAELADGETAQASVAPGSYSVSEDAVAGWDVTALECSDDDSGMDLAARTATFEVAPGEAVTCVFTNTARAQLSGRQFEDVDADGSSRQPSDPRMSGWLVYLDLDADGQLDGPGAGAPEGEPTTETGEDGYYEFTDLRPGTYTVRQVTSEDWACSFPARCFWDSAQVVSLARVDLAPGQSRQDLDFGAWRRGSVAGSKFEDANGDGARQAGERPLGGFVFYLDVDGDATRDGGEPAATSAADGSWTIASVQPGSYTVREDEQGGYRCTAPANCRASVTVRSGGRADAGEFGNQLQADPTTPRTSEPPPPVVEGARRLRGTARLAGPEGCVARGFTARVTGRGIARVTFYLDGRRIRTLTRPDRRGRWGVRVDPRRMRAGVHRMRTEVRFAADRSPRSRRLRLVFQRCGGAVRPRFTG